MVGSLKVVIPMFILRNHKSSNVPSSTLYPAIDAGSFKIARENSNPESFSTAIKPFIAPVSRQGFSRHGNQHEQLTMLL